MAVPVQVTGEVAVGLSVVVVGLAAPAVNVCDATKIVVKMRIAPAVAPSIFKTLFDFGVLDFLITNVSLGGGWVSDRVAPDNLASSLTISMTDGAI
jgi:hypothetical protein